MCSRWGHDTGGCWRGARVAVESASKRHMGVQHAALQYMVDMWKFSSQPVVSDAAQEIIAPQSCLSRASASNSMVPAANAAARDIPRRGSRFVS